MSIKISRLPLDAHLDAYRSFSTGVWPGRPSTPGYLAWRAECPGQVAEVARDESGRWLAAIFARARRYRIDGQAVECFEPYDWFCHPEYLGSGLGILVRRALMRAGQPVIALGGSDDTLNMLPRLGYQRVAEGLRYWRPLSAAALRARGAARSKRLAFALGGGVALGAVASWRRWRDARAHPTELRPVAPSAIADAVAAATEALEADPVSELAPLPDAALCAWLARAPEIVGRYELLEVWVRGRRAGLALLRVYGPGRARKGQIVELHLTAAASDGAAAVVGSLSARLARAGCTQLLTAATAPWLASALRRQHFRWYAQAPLLVWSRPPLDADRSDVHVTSGRGDGAFVLLEGDTD